MNTNVFFCFTYVLFLSFVADSCKIKPVPSPGGWETGTSINLFTNDTREKFSAFQSVGGKYLELGSGNFRRNPDEDRDVWSQKIIEKVKQAEETGLKIWSVHLPYEGIYDISQTNVLARENAVRELNEVINLGKFFKLEKYVVHGSSDILNESERPQRIENCIASLKVLNEEVKKQGAQLAVECLSRTCLGNTSGELLYIVNSVGDEIGICFDSNHLMYEKPEEFVEKAGGLICTVHISDYDGTVSRHWLPGRGVINWGKVVSALLQTGYEGPFMFEVKNRPGEPFIDAKMLAESWEMIKKEYHQSISK
jgi:sugar phosphate isomerase/epimerase